LASFTEGPVKHTHSPGGARRPTTKYVGSKLIFLTCTHQMAPLSRSGSATSAGCRRFFLPLLFSALVWGDPLRIYGKALRLLKLESSRQPTMKIWWF